MRADLGSLLNHGAFSEIYDEGLEYAFLHEDDTPAHQTVLCKDFLSDCIWSETTKRPVHIYDFKWRPGTLNLRNRMKIALRFKGVSLSEPATRMEKFLNQWSDRFDFGSITVETEPGKDLCVVNFDSRWLNQPIRLSLLTLLMRVGLEAKDDEPVFDLLKRVMKDGNPYGEDDRKYLRRCHSKLEKLWNGHPWPPQRYEDYTELYELHDMSGIVNYKM